MILFTRKLPTPNRSTPHKHLGQQQTENLRVGGSIPSLATIKSFYNSRYTSLKRGRPCLPALCHFRPNPDRFTHTLPTHLRGRA